MISFLKQRNGKLEFKDITLEQLFKRNAEFRGDQIEIPKAWRQISWLRRCVMIRANALAAIPFTIREVGSEEPVYDSEHTTIPERLDFMGNPVALLSRIEASVALEGCAFLLKTTRLGEISRLQWFSPTSVRLDIDTRSGEITFERTLSEGQIVRYKESQVLHFFQDDVYAEVGPGRNSSDAHTGKINSQTLYNTDSFTRNYTGRGLIKATLVSVPRATPPEQRDLLERWFNKFYSGKRVEQKVLQSGAVEVTPIGEGLSDLSDVNLTEDQRKAIAAAIGVPFSLVDSTSPSNAVKRADKLDLYDHLLKARAKIIQGVLNQQLFREMGLEFQFHMGRVDIFQAIALEKATAVAMAAGGPALTRNEGRELLDRQPIDDPKMNEVLEVIAQRFANTNPTPEEGQDQPLVGQNGQN